MSPPTQATCSPPTSGCYDVLSPTLRHRMMGCVLLRAQVTEQAAAAAEKVDQHHLPPPEEVVDEAAQLRPLHTVEETAHQHPLLPEQVPPRVDDVRDKLAVTDEQGELAVRGFSSSFISSPRRFLPQLLLPSFSYFQTPQCMPSSLEASQPCSIFPCSSLPHHENSCQPTQAVQCSRTAICSVLVVQRKYWDKSGGGGC